MKSIEELSKLTGLQIKFIRRCMIVLSDILAEHTARGDKNKILYSDNAVVIFNQIKVFKDKDYSLPSIKNELIKSLGIETAAQENEPQLVITEPEYKHVLLDSENKKVSSQLITMITEKDSQLSKQQLAIETLQKSIFELTQEKSNMENSIRLLTDGKTPDEALKEKYRKQTAHVRIIEVLKELELLDGHVFKSKYRKQLLQELRELQVPAV